jgi:hypothetical protein
MSASLRPLLEEAVVHVLALGEPKPLFAGTGITDVSEGHARAATNAVQQINPDVLLNTPTDDLLASLVEEHSITPPVIKRDEAYIDGPHEVEIRKIDYGSEVTVPGTLVALVVPFEGEPRMFYINPNRWGHSIRAQFDRNNIILAMRDRELKAERVNKELGKRLDEIEEFLEQQRDFAKRHREMLPQRLRPLIEERKRKLLADRQMVSGLSFPIRERKDTPKTYTAPVVRKKLEMTRPATTQPFVPEPVLDEANYRAILDIIQSMTMVMERSPTAFASMGEEDLRQHYLVQLNGHFEGAASGETFNYQGKTDILIRERDRNIFVAECKFWGGEKAFLATVDQLLGYLSWRDTKAAVIVFNRNKHFSGVLETIEAALSKHPHCKKGPTKKCETEFRCVFGNPSDHNREIIVTVLAFNIPTAP